MANKVVFTDKGLKKILAEVKRIAGMQVQVGLVGAKAEAPTADGRLTVAEAGIINEFGSGDGHVPRRSFLRDPMHQQRGLVTSLLLQAAGDVATLKATPEAVCDRIGTRLALVVSDAILAGGTPHEGNAASTIKKKGFDEPLVDTGTMLDAVGHRTVRDSGGGTLEAGSSVGDYESFEVSE